MLIVIIKETSNKMIWKTIKGLRKKLKCYRKVYA